MIVLVVYFFTSVTDYISYIFKVKGQTTTTTTTTKTDALEILRIVYRRLVGEGGI